MNDHAELSLSVARIMWPELPWRTSVGSQVIATKFTGMDRDEILMVFDYRTDDAGFKMAAYIATNVLVLGDSEEPGDYIRSCMIIDRLLISLSKKDNRALAEAIKEIDNG